MHNVVGIREKYRQQSYNLLCIQLENKNHQLLLHFLIEIKYLINDLKIFNYIFI